MLYNQGSVICFLYGKFKCYITTADWVIIDEASEI